MEHWSLSLVKVKLQITWHRQYFKVQISQTISAIHGCLSSTNNQFRFNFLPLSMDLSELLYPRKQPSKPSCRPFLPEPLISNSQSTDHFLNLHGSPQRLWGNGCGFPADAPLSMWGVAASMGKLVSRLILIQFATS